MKIILGRNKNASSKFEEAKFGAGTGLFFGEEGVDVRHLATSAEIFIGAG